MEIKKISKEEFDKLLNSGNNGKYKPTGLFYIKEDDGSVTGVDNSTGDAWTENFSMLKECIDWLKGEDNEKPLEKVLIGSDDLERTYIDFSETYDNNLVKIVQENKISRTNIIWLDIEQTKKLYQALSKFFKGGITKK